MLKYLKIQIRKLLGTHYIIKELEAAKYKNQQQLLLLGNAISFLMKDNVEIKKSGIYKRTSEIIELLKPMEIENGEYVRVGKDNDGGYVMLNNDYFKSSKVAYSFGISNDTSWDQEIASAGKLVFMYDHTIDKLPQEHPNFRYFKVGLTGSKRDPNLKTIEELLLINKHSDNENILMKMDIEDCEWDVFNEVASETLNKFSQIVLEFHNLSPFLAKAKFDMVINVLNKINLTHQSVHIHANSDICIPHMIADLVLPTILEVTYVRKQDVDGLMVANKRTFPTEIDQPTFSGQPDIFLGLFSANSK